MKLIFLFLLLFHAAWAIAAPIKVDVDRKKVNLNESFQVIFSTTEDIYSTPDFSALEAAFEVIDRDQSSATSWVNGVESFSMKWSFTLMAKRAGVVTIPALPFGNETSPAVSIEVTENSPKTDVMPKDEELFVDVSAKPKQNYLQAQILYSVKIFARVDITAAQLTDPSSADAVIKQLGKEISGRTDVNGLNYLVVERRYAIYPQKSGKITIAPVVLTAEILGTDGLGMPSSRTKRAASKALTLNVLPMPQDFKEHWLPAQGVNLKQEWSENLENIKVGEPLTRTLTLTAKGASVGQLPKLSPPTDSGNLKSYPAQPRLEEQKDPEGLAAVTTEKIAYIASKEGTYTLPAVEVPWFNVNTQKMERAVVPGVTFKAVAVNKTAEAVVKKNTVKAVANPNAAKKTTSATAWIENYLWLGLLICFVLGLLVSAAFFVFKKQGVSLKKGKLVQARTTEEEENNLITLRKACANNDANAAKQALIVWGMRKYGVNTLGAIAECCEGKLKDEILALNYALYGQKTHQWDGRKLFRAFSDYKETTSETRKADDKLEPLHRL